jgi:uncharacterized membrane protein YkoI
MRNTRLLTNGLLVLGLATALAFPIRAEAKEEKVKLTDCPEAIQKTIKEQASGGGKILEIEKETQKDGTVIYEAEIKKADGKTIEIEVSSDGKLLKTENEDDEDDDGEDAD